MRSPKTHSLYLFPLIFLLLHGCKYPSEYKTVDAGEKFSLAIPSWVKEDTKLKPGAEFQYANRYRNFYAIGEVVHDGKANSDPGQLMNTNLNILRKAMKNPVVSDSVQVTIGGLNGIHAEIFGKMNDENIYFSEVVLAGKNHFYHLSVWTRGEDRKLRFKEDINRLLNSFKEKG